MSILPSQCRGARAMLGWTQGQLAHASGMAKNSIADFETSKRVPYHRTILDIVSALNAAGVIFVEEDSEGPGVRLRKSTP